MGDKTMNLMDLAEQYSSPDAAREHLERIRWPEGPICPHCGLLGEAFKLTPKAKKPVEIEYQTKQELKTQRVRKPRKGLWKCSGCRKQFTVTVGTIFEDSHIPLNKWLMAFHLLCASKKGMSAHQLHRMLGVTYKSAWFMAHRIRYAMTQKPLSSKLTGIIEVDEVYIGGKRRYSQPLATKPGQRAKDRLGPFADKAAVVSVLQRNGRVQSTHIERVTGENLKGIIEGMCAEDAHVMTDSAAVLKGLLKTRKHSRVDHKAKEYVRWEDGVCITTNTVEGYFANLRRGIDGVYHHVGRQHLHRYLSEFDFRYNARGMKDGERTITAIEGAAGKRLMLRDSKERAS
jgi:transposase-like protein